MKRILSYIPWVFALPLLLLSCNNEPKVEGTVINGAIPDAANMSIKLDKLVIGKQAKQLATVQADAEGKFQFLIPTSTKPELYQVRAAQNKFAIITSGSEQINVSGTFNDLRRYSYTAQGSPATQSYSALMNRVSTNSGIKIDDIGNYIDSTSNPLAACLLAQTVLRGDPSTLEMHKTAIKRLEEMDATNSNIASYQSFIAQIESYKQQQQKSAKIQVGQPAPDIKLPNPNGVEYALSDLKGQIVLLDFWASWCGPCRRENPHVVEVYNKYKDRGFTVYSVSLDGLDTRTKQRYNNNQTTIDQQMKVQKDKWIAAIEKDGLPWKYHVSDLKKWECAPAREYGVRSIPHTFLIDRDGNIAATKLRGASQIESELLKLL